jgi:hypothetical protein
MRKEMKELGKLNPTIHGNGALDEIVFTVMEYIANGINSEGFDSQVEFLKKHGWTEEKILEWIYED